MSDFDFSQFKLWEREAIFTYLYTRFTDIDFPHSRYAVAWEDPDDMDAPMKVTHASPVWLAMAMHGGILPPAWVYQELREDEAREGFTRHKRGHLLHETPPVAAMTEEQAIDYLIEAFIPPSVWRDYRGNRTLMKVLRRADLPSDRSQRNAWRVNQEAA